MTEKELRIWMLQDKMSDAWWVSIDGVLASEPVRLSDVFRQEGVRDGVDLLVLHDSQKDAEDPPWVALDPASKLSSEKRQALSRRRKIKSRVPLQIALLAIVLGAALFFVFKPKSAPKPEPVAPLEKMLNELQASSESGLATEDPKYKLPPLKTVVACTERVLYVTNLSGETWPSVEIVLDGPDGYVLTRTQTIQPDITLDLPLRSFEDNGVPFPQGEQKPKRVIITVPGFRPYEDYFR